MIAYALLLLVATPIFGVPVSENVAAEQSQKQHEVVQQSVNTAESIPQTLSVQYPFGQPSYPNVPYYTRKTESGVVEVPLTPDAIVIPYSYPNYQNYQHYPNSRNQYPAPYYQQYNQYNQQPYVPEPFLVVPVPNIQRVTPNTYVPQYDSAPRLLYYLPKSYYPTGYQTPTHHGQQFQSQQQNTQEVGPKTVSQGQGVAPQGQTGVETNQSVGVTTTVEQTHHQ